MKPFDSMMKQYNKKSDLSFLVFAALTIACVGCASGKKATVNIGQFPQGSTPQEVGKRIAERYLAMPYGNFNRPQPPKYIAYPETCTWYGALEFAKVTGDND